MGGRMMNLLPDSAPFSDAQRAWLNGLIAGMMSLDAATSATPAPAVATNEPEDTPWHDPALSLDERMGMADAKPLRLKLMAAMGQLDCGQCGYLCDSYATAIASGAEKDVGKCVPGGKPTSKIIKKLLAESPVAEQSQTPALARLPEQNAATTPANAGVSLFDVTPTRDRPAKLKLLRGDFLNRGEADKDTRGIVLSLKNSALAYEVGDSLGIWPTNNPDEVELILSILRAKGNKTVTLDGEALNAREALTRKVNLREVTAELFALMAEHASLDFEAQRLAMLAKNDERAGEYGIHDVFDTLVKFRSARPPVGQFVQTLARLQPRLYSIASSMKAHPEEVHLTIGVVRYDLNGRRYQGLGSGFFADHLQAGRPVPAFVQKSHGFRLPADQSKPVIMVGPGTGIAPFRAFLQERAATKAPGKNWLFFGAQHAATDFLYEAELKKYADDGVLTKLGLAFSRDQSEKIYVQHRMLENATEIWTWLNEGAHFYVCGDAKRMAADVDHALTEIVTAEGGMSAEAAKAWVKKLAQDGRYLRDVY